MAETLQIAIYERHKLVYTADLLRQTELGRQDRGEPPPYCEVDAGATRRIIIAPTTEEAISRKQLALEPLPENKLRIANLSRSQPLWLENGVEIKPTSSCDVFVPAVVIIGQRAIRVRGEEPEQLQSLARSTPIPGRETILAQQPVPPTSVGAADGDRLLYALQVMVAVMESAATSRDFYPKAALAMIKLIGLDSGRVLLLKDGQWEVAAAHSESDATRSLWEPSRSILSRLVQEKRTFWQTAAASAAAASLAAVSAVVVAPILSRDGEVMGALYGDRRQGGAATRPIGKLEAMLVELLAGAVAAGLARVEQEDAALKSQALFEQFFSAELSEELARDPGLLEVRDALVTILFCDVRGFSRISERIGPKRTVEWINDTMQSLSTCVLGCRGVLVDYIGDELMAMWGAPKSDADHACQACTAALRMFECLPALNARWQSILGEPIKIGVGIHTGDACVGNVGSRIKFKYGPLGNTNNVASRIQGSTKYFKAPALVSGDTRAVLGEQFRVRRLGKVRVVNVAKAVDIYELAGASDSAPPAWPRLRERYESALANFENRDFAAAARLLGDLMTEHPEDGPSLVLMSRAINCLVSPPVEFDPVWELPGK